MAVIIQTCISIIIWASRYYCTSCSFCPWPGTETAWCSQRTHKSVGPANVIVLPSSFGYHSICYLHDAVWQGGLTARSISFLLAAPVLWHIPFAKNVWTTLLLAADGLLSGFLALDRPRGPRLLGRRELCAVFKTTSQMRSQAIPSEVPCSRPLKPGFFKLRTLTSLKPVVSFVCESEETRAW